MEPTVTKTFRLAKKIADAVSEESGRASVSENIIVNQTLRRWAIFDRFVSRQNIMMFNRRIFSRMVTKLSDQDLESIAKEFGAHLANDLFELTGMRCDKENVINYFLKTVLSDSMRWYTYEHHGSVEEGSFVLRHDLGKTWSTFLRTFIDVTLHECLNLTTSFRLSLDTVQITYSSSQKTHSVP